MTEKKKYNRRKGRECTVTVKQGRLLLSAAAGELFGSWADLYESGSVMALVPALEGDLHLLSNSSRSTRKDISCQSLYSYLREKYSLNEGQKLTAWVDVPSGALLFGIPDNAVKQFGVGFGQLHIPIERNEKCSVFQNHGALCLSRAAARRLPDRVNVYEHGGVLCIAGSKRGSLELVSQDHSAKAIFSDELMQYVREKYDWKNGALPARILDGRVYFSTELPGAEQDFRSFRPLDVRATQANRVSLLKSGVVRLSASIATCLGDSVALYESPDGHILALAPDSGDGTLHLGRRQGKGGAVVASSALSKQIQQVFGCGAPARFFAHVNAGTVFFSDKPFIADGLNLSRFRKSRIRTRYSPRIRLADKEIYIGKSLHRYLQGRFSVYVLGGGIALLEEPAGVYQIKKSIVKDQDLVRFLRDWGRGREYLFARPLEHGLLLVRSEAEALSTRALVGSYPESIGALPRDWQSMESGRYDMDGPAARNNNTIDPVRSTVPGV